jgi:hypothetical protein
MSSREFDSMLDDLVRQALYPFQEAEPPMRVWRRVLRAVRSMSAESVISDGLLAVVSSLAPVSLLTPSLLAAFSHWSGFLQGIRRANVMYVPSFSNRSYYVDPSGRYPSSPFWDITWTQMFDLRLAS